MHCPNLMNAVMHPILRYAHHNQNGFFFQKFSTLLLALIALADDVLL